MSKVLYTNSKMGLSRHVKSVFFPMCVTKYLYICTKMTYKRMTVFFVSLFHLYSNDINVDGFADDDVDADEKCDLDKKLEKTASIFHVYRVFVYA